MQCCHYLVTGRVQGVSFRNFTWKRATALGIRGWVRNLRDGRVEILAAGPDDKLREFETAIGKGSLLARVDGVEKRSVDWQAPSAEFKITQDGETPWQAQH